MKQVGFEVEINLKFHREVWFDEDENPTEEDAIDYVVGNLFEAIESEVRKLCPYLEDFDIDDFDEREN